MKKTDFMVTKVNIEKIVSRMNNRIMEKQKRKQENQKRLDKWCQALLFPVVLAVFSTAIESQTDLTVMIVYAASLLITVGCVCLAVHLCMNFILFFGNRRLVEMKSFADDLQGIIDTQFHDKLIIIPVESISSGFTPNLSTTGDKDN